MAGAVFLFGKLPAHGDFVSRGLSEGRRQAWDDWASAALDRLREASADFEAAHDAAAPWRFVAGPSLLGDGWRCGALAPSIDSAGRRFVLAAGIDGLDAGQAAVCGVPLAAAIETLLYRALGEAMTADDAAQALTDELAAASESFDIAEALAAPAEGPGAWWSAHSGLPVRATASPPPDLLAAACALEPRSTAA